jgi:hypothetical protein
VQRDLPSGPGQERHTVTSGSAVETIDLAPSDDDK